MSPFSRAYLYPCQSPWIKNRLITPTKTTDFGNSEEGVGDTAGDGMEVGVPGGPAPPFHQIKSFQLLQELQNEVGALLEFREVVMEAFPQLKAKLRGGGSRWEPGVRVRRKQPAHKDVVIAASNGLSEPPRSRSNSRSKSGGGGGGGGGAPSTLIQDSGFSTADSSGTTGNGSKKHLLPPEDELWALLELIQAKGTRLRLEVECMKERVSLPGMSGRSRSLGELRVPSDLILQEKEELCCRVAELERENVERASAAAALSRRVSELQEDKRRLEGELAEARGPMRDRLKEDKLKVPDEAGLPSLYRHSPVPSVSARRKLECEFGRHTPISVATSRGDNLSSPSSTLGRLDGLVSSPAEVIPCPKGLTPDRQVTAAILKETNVLELQRHLITTTHHAQVIQAQLDKTSKAKESVIALLEKAREENEDLRFQLEEKSIELEGTRARVRLLERGVGNSTAVRGSSESSAPPSEDNSSTESGRAGSAKQPVRRPSRIPLKAPPNSLQPPQASKLRPPNHHQPNKLSFWSNWLRISPHQ
uniref:Myosin-7 n=2 Tax=Lygus hesperus TaxID=30085 RepID=A0A0A9VYW2_LYGHE